MASEQVRRENVTDQRKAEVEKDVVPKMRTHFESLAEKAKTPPASPGEKVHQYETLPVGEGRQGPSLEEISGLRATAQQNSMDAIMVAQERYEKGRESENQGKVQQAKDYTAQKAGEAKGSVSSKGGDLKDTVVEKGQQAKDYTVKKTMETKDTIASTGQSAAGYAADKAKAAKDTTLDASRNVACYVGDRAAAAKDATVEGGKGAAGYAGKVAVEAKDQAVATGWGATHYTLDKVAEATKTVAGVASNVAGYTGETAVAAKDKVVGAGQTVVDYAGEKLGAAKDTVVASREKAADYTGRKKEEAQKDLEENKALHEGGGRGETFEPTGKFLHGRAEDEQMPRPGNGGAGGVLQAIGETIMEIGQTTKELLVGQYPIRVLDQREQGSKDREDEPYHGSGEGI